jgi:RNA polymerase sigma factor (sigma-70 family)
MLGNRLLGWVGLSRLFFKGESMIASEVASYETSPLSGEPPIHLQRPMQRAALNDQQQLLVKGNIGLVYVHLKNYVTPHRIPWTRREWEDLVQEGCLGLIRAAQDFNPQGKIPFAAFALPRIHTAVHRFMTQRFGNGIAFAGGESPAKRSLFGTSHKPDWSPRKRRRNPADDDPLELLGDWWGSNEDTLGVRMREKYERAVHRAVAQILAQSESNDTHGELLRTLAADRHLVPDAHARKQYRQIASRTGAPYARVIQLDRQLRETIRVSLGRDPEFAELQRIARAEPRGVDTPVNENFEQSLARLSAAELLQRLLHSPGERREKLVKRLFDQATQSLLQAIRNELESLPVAAREDLLHDSSPVYVDLQSQDQGIQVAPAQCGQPNVSPASPSLATSNIVGNEAFP